MLIRRHLLALLVVLPGIAAGGTTYSTDSLFTQVNERIRVYARAFPDIGFVRLYGAENHESLQQLAEILSHGATNVDYEHPESVRDDLVALQLNRIALMLDNEAPSATLFRLDSGNPFPHQYLCAVTLDTSDFEHDPAAATRFLYDHASADIGTAEHLANAPFLRFTVDHEVFHCLDAYLNGPMFPMANANDALDYPRFRAEFRADYFASLTHLSEAGSRDFVHQLLRARKAAGQQGDCHHFTPHAMVAALVADPDTLPDANMRQAVLYAMSSAKRVLPDAEYFGLQMAQSCGVVQGDV